jgi:hypothetical protein
MQLKNPRVICLLVFTFLIVCSAHAQESTETNDKSQGESLVKDFHFSTGYRLSFVEKNNQSFLYYDISLFYPKWKKVRNKFIGLDFGLYQTGITGSPVASTNQPFLMFNEPDFYKKINADTVQVINRTYYRTILQSKTERNLSIYFSPTIQLTENIFGLIHLEHYSALNTISIKDSLYESDFSKVSYSKYFFNFYPVPKFGTTMERSQFNTSTLGIGAIFKFDLPSDYLFRIKPIIGYRYSRTVSNSISSFNETSYGTTGYFKIDFRLIHGGSFPFKIGGEVLGDFQTGIYSTSLYISKIFSPDKVLGLFTDK